MIMRSNDFSTLSDESLKNLKEKLNINDNRKLYKTCISEKEVAIAKNELKLKGYNSEVEKLGEAMNVYKVLPENILLSEANKSGNFKKLAWGRYCFQKVNSINGFEDYPFDDGSIWKVITNDDGEEVLVKEVDDNNQIVRNASIKKVASIEINDMNYQNIFKVLYTDENPQSQLITDILGDSNGKQDLYRILTDKLNSIIIENTQMYNLDNTKLDELNSILMQGLNDYSISSIDMLKQKISDYVQAVTV